jgi:hypothetical protein
LQVAYSEPVDNIGRLVKLNSELLGSLTDFRMESAFTHSLSSPDVFSPLPSVLVFALPSFKARIGHPTDTISACVVFTDVVGIFQPPPVKSLMYRNRQIRPIGC